MLRFGMKSFRKPDRLIRCLASLDETKNNEILRRSKPDRSLSTTEQFYSVVPQDIGAFNLDY
jgi:hypothetical protein